MLLRSRCAWKARHIHCRVYYTRPVTIGAASSILPVYELHWLMPTSPISLDDIACYRSWDGDVDALARSTDRGRSAEAWRVLDDLRQRAFLIATGQGSDAFAARLEAELATNIPDAEARAMFRSLVSADVSKAARQGERR